MRAEKLLRRIRPPSKCSCVSPSVQLSTGAPSTQMRTASSSGRKEHSESTTEP